MTNEKILEEFDREFVKDCGPDVEPIFIDAVGSVGPIRQFLSDKLDQARAEERARVVGIFDALPSKFWEDQDHSVGGYISKKDLRDLLISIQDNPKDKE